MAAFLVARQDGVAVGCGAVRRISPTTAEVKRMFVTAAAHGGGVGGRLLAELEAWARRAGMHAVGARGWRPPGRGDPVLRTGGFVAIPCFGEYAEASLSRCYEKVLGAADG